MFTGHVEFLALLLDNPITFGRVKIEAFVPGVDAVEIVAQKNSEDQYEISGAVHIASIDTIENGNQLAKSAIIALLNRLSFTYDVAIDWPRIKHGQFNLLNSGGHLIVGTAHLAVEGQVVRLVHGISQANLKSDLEQQPSAGESWFGLFRSARLSTGHVEEFMTLYNILLSFFDDKQIAVDGFIVRVEPTVPQTQHPVKKIGTMESLYSRLRNEFSHKRIGVDLDTTKASMAMHVAGLRKVVKAAILERAQSEL